ncbi:MAG: class I SAM-dependent RNA methyltransferase [Nitriliruptoraceae bacterium]
MNRQVPLSRELQEVVVDGFTHGGEGVARIEGKAVFVAGTLPGERVMVRVIDDRKRWARAELVDVITPSEDRVEPPCPYVGSCGGCDLQHASPRAQRALKTRVVIEQLERLGGIQRPPVEPCRAVGPDLGYRNHAQFHAADDGRLGFRRAGSHDVVPIDRCLVLADEVQHLRTEVGDSTGASAVAMRAHSAPDGDHAHDTDQTSAAVVVTPGAGGLDLPEGKFDILLAQPGGNTVPLRGSGTLSISVAGLNLSYPADGFFQVNVSGAEALVAAVLEAVGDISGALVWDLYAGVGLLSIPLAQAGGEVVAVESHESAARHADLNVDRHGVDIEVLALPTEKVTSGSLGSEGPDDPDVVVLDPPRAGAGPQVVNDLVRLSPATIVYVACDVAALARDARVLIEGGYRLISAVPLDLFPMTHHVEVVATFSR